MARIDAADADLLPVILSFDEPGRRADFLTASRQPESLKERYQLAVTGAVNDAWVTSASISRPPREHRSIGAVSVSLPLGVLKALSDRGEDVGLRRGGIELDYPLTTALNAVRTKVGVNVARTHGWTGRGVRVAVVDTGIARNHIDLENRVIDSVDFTGEGPGDLNGHGTHVAGIVGGSGRGAEGKYSGVAPGVELLDGKVLGRDGGGKASSLISAIEWAVERQAKVVNISIEGPASDGSDAMSRSVNWAVEQGTVVCVAAGNQGPGSGTVTTPGTASGAITIGAIDRDDRVAEFSSRGGAAAGQDNKPDLVLPGFVVSCRTPGLLFDNIVDELYRLETGTSQACPIAAGFCAMLLQADPTLTPAALKTLLKETAVDLRFSAADQGAGRGDIERALRAKGFLPPTPTEEQLVLGAVTGERGLTPNSIGRVRIELTNRRESPVLNVRAQISTEDGDVSVLSPTGDYGTLHPGETDSATYLVEYGDVSTDAVGFKLTVRYSEQGGEKELILPGSLPVNRAASGPPLPSDTLASLLGESFP
jgi:hypothetical protein